MSNICLQKYKYIIAYGIGQNYFHMKDRMTDVKIDYVMDQRWENTIDEYFDGIPIIRSRDVENLDNYLIIVFPSNEMILTYVKNMYRGDVCHSSELWPLTDLVTGEQLRAKLPEVGYKDPRGNIIEYDETISKEIKIYFFGNNNRIKIGNNVSINRLSVFCGNNGVLQIGDNSTVEGAEIATSYAGVSIGNDCMLAYNIVIRNHDNHHIFDKNSRERINPSKDVVIGNQVWIGEGATLLAGANIGTGSIVGEKAVTSSTFPDHVIIAGSPAKVIRENICWSRDNTFYFDRSNLDECIDQNAKKYM